MGDSKKILLRKKGKKRVGFPRALLYFYFQAMWESFFEALGAEIVLSSPSTKITKENGVQETLDDECYSTKLYHGHVLDLMEKNLVTITPEKDLFEAIRVMRDHNIRHLPVMYKGKFLGLVTMKDILKLEPDLFDLLVKKFEVREERKILQTETEEGVCELCGEYAKEITNIDGITVCPNCEDEL